MERSLLFVYILGLAVFAQGTSEFMLSGLVPDIALELAVPVGAAATLTSAYAVGMVAGAPVMAALSARWPRRRALVTFLVVFVAMHVVGAVTSDFTVLFGTRVVAAVANAGFLAVAMTVVGARGAAVLIGGVTLSCVVGVPAGALLGQFYGWRAAFWAVAALSLPALAFVVRAAPAEPAGVRDVDVRREFRELRSRPLRRTLLLGALVNGATFATFAYLAVIATDVAGLPDGAVPGLLAAFGLGAFLGVTARMPDRWLTAGLFVLPAGWLVLVLLSTHPVPFFVATAVQGALSFGVGSVLITRVLRLAPGAPSLGGAFATVALNVGAVLGPAVAGAVTEATGDHRHAVWLSVAAALVATACAPRHR
ncbi:DHA1 family chloramphenicol resistance protein-like MFS transporter [Actinophytocola algeriensis]|uniref:DHA1 family chloramphenicol resistance protein-like MFS transporter n=1 Tax=Actinophytocola algeriensis TaxID=1768010 RepID=A0A7W7Q144_9PSEU|nr:Cmx/CmrA family chloramphenicol efflux MFS transporter [Actinophytocola algeriensis]MBB4905035.1 DHA1 family chloramphenicol resistance protein-like MFS transporter [Actinophytocola algeriensis]MBE1476105.1 DHA1 family chloramphenicol resistance protein-like MFS transporter [Actinophytocola algeriensis]